MSGIAFKLTTLFVRQISKPIANVIKTEAKGHPFFKKVCIRVAQTMHFMENNLRFQLLGSKSRMSQTVRPLNEAKAIQSGADFLSEFFIFSVAGGGILFESYRSRKKEMGRREAVADDIKMLQDELDYLKKQLKDYNLKIEDFKTDSNNYKPVVLKIDENGHVLNEKNDLQQGIKEVRTVEDVTSSLKIEGVKGNGSNEKVEVVKTDSAKATKDVTIKDTARLTNEKKKS